MEILRYLETSRIVQNFDVIDHRRWDKGQYLNLRIEFIDASILFVREYYDEISRNYSFHWQNKDDNLICRWDNAPHYPEHLTFPHHKHQETTISESREIKLEEVLKIIENRIKTQSV